MQIYVNNVYMLCSKLTVMRKFWWLSQRKKSLKFHLSFGGKKIRSCNATLIKLICKCSVFAGIWNYFHGSLLYYQFWNSKSFAGNITKRESFTAGFFLSFTEAVVIHILTKKEKGMQRNTKSLWSIDVNMVALLSLKPNK